MMLNERLRYLEENHKREIGVLNEKMQKIFRQTGELEEKVRISDREWNKYMQTYNGY